MDNKSLIAQFYSSFANGDAQAMVNCYHPEVTFQDPAFGELKGAKAKAMWQMLLSKKEGSQLSITYSVLSDKSAQWVATYNYGPRKRPVINKVIASFEYKDGKIYKHSDSFSLWKWSYQALGFSGLLLGWSPFLKNKIQVTTHNALNRFMAK